MYLCIQARYLLEADEPLPDLRNDLSKQQTTQQLPTSSHAWKLTIMPTGAVLESTYSLVFFAGQVYHISPFSDKYALMSNVEVCAAATAWDDHIMGHTSVLEFHQGMWFDSKLPKLPYYSGSMPLFGISALCNNPFDLYSQQT